MYKTIVVPLDGSKLAEAALPYAEELGTRTGSDIILLSVLESSDLNKHEKHQIYANRIQATTRHHADKYLDLIRSEVANIKTATRIGNPAEAIVEYAGNGGQSLVVMATHGRSGISRWALGSVADKVARTPTNLPVMLIRAKDARPDVREKRLLKKVLVPMDGSKSSKAVVPYISQLALKLGMAITLLQVVTQNNHDFADATAYLQSVCAELEQQGIATTYEVRLHR
ncbi:universal stress protein [Chloroflexota bacterium]